MDEFLGSIDFGTLAIVFGVLVVSITIHEAMHAFTGYWLGDDTAQREGRISLNPIKHIDPFMTILLPLLTLLIFKAPLLVAKPVPFNPNRVKFEDFGAALVGLAGPLTNLVLAAAGAGVLRLFGTDLGDLGVQIVGIFTVINVGLFVFNMLPIPPLDGSRVLYAFAPDPLRRVMEALEQWGIVVIFSLVLLVPGFTDLLSNLNSAVINWLLQ